MDLRSPRRAPWLCLLALAAPAHADANDPVVVQVGPLSLHVSDVERRLARVPDFQRRTFGNGGDDPRQSYVNTVLVPELLFAASAEQGGLASAPRVRLQLREALARSLGDALLRDAASPALTDAELRAYYATHESDYEKPERIRVSRILVDDPALAEKIAGEARGKGGPDRWNQLARDNSLDLATRLRGGDLGFVLPDGRTEVPQVEVDPALYAAAARVKDGELVPSSVKEGAHLAVVWRRGTLAKVARPFDSAEGEIRTILTRERAEHALAALREELRKRDLKDLNPAPLETLTFDLPKEAAPRAMPSGSAGPVNPVPRASERGLR